MALESHFGPAGNCHGHIGKPRGNGALPLMDMSTEFVNHPVDYCVQKCGAPFGVGSDASPMPIFQRGTWPSPETWSQPCLLSI